MCDCDNMVSYSKVEFVITLTQENCSGSKSEINLTDSHYENILR